MTDREKKIRKAAYDKRYRKKNRERLRLGKAEWFRRTYDPIKAAKKRKRRMPEHARYCRQGWYRKYKSQYDRVHRASLFGPFAEAYLMLRELIKEIKRQEPDRDERYRQAGRFAWNPEVQKRRREIARQKTEQFIQSIALNGAES